LAGPVDLHSEAAAEVPSPELEGLTRCLPVGKLKAVRYGSPFFDSDAVMH